MNIKKRNDENTICDIHNIPYSQYNNGNRFVCKACCNERVANRRRELKKMAVEYKGGKCCKCGYNKTLSALEFHHIDPAEKDFSISKNGHTKSFEKIKLELDKCILVCANCHREIHDELNNGSLAQW